MAKGESQPRRDEWRGDDWGRRCREDYAVASAALRSLAKENWWEARWSEALYAWAEDHLVLRSWEDMSGLLVEAPAEMLQFPGVSFWLRSAGRKIDVDDARFVEICGRVLESVESDNAGEAGNPVDRALNRPTGQVVEGLLDWTLRRSVDDVGLPVPVRRLLAEVCDPGTPRYGTGRVMVASRVLPLWVRDEAWSASHVLPLFEWSRSETEACAAWRDFLWAPRLHEGFLAAVRRSFIAAARHYGDLGSHGRQYVGLLTSAGLHLREDGWTRGVKEAVGELPDAGLQQALAALGRALAPEQRRPDYFRNRVLPFIRQIWPKTTDKLTAGVSAGFARLCLVADDAFPEVFGAVRDYLTSEGQRAAAYVMLSFKERTMPVDFPPKRWNSWISCWGADLRCW